MHGLVFNKNLTLFKYKYGASAEQAKLCCQCALGRALNTYTLATHC